MSTKERAEAVNEIRVLASVAVSCCVTCGYTAAFDIVLNSLAFTFISQVGA